MLTTIIIALAAALGGTIAGSRSRKLSRVVDAGTAIYRIVDTVVDLPNATTLAHLGARALGLKVSDADIDKAAVAILRGAAAELAARAATVKFPEPPPPNPNAHTIRVDADGRRHIELTVGGPK